MENLNVENRTDEELGDMTHYISQYNCTIKYNPGKNNVEADFFSRNPVLKPDENKDDVLKTVNDITLQEIIDDKKLNTQLIKDEHNFTTQDEIYYRNIKNKKKIVLSEEYSKTLIKRTHENYCHTGMKQTTRKIKPFYTAPNLSEKIQRICKNCEVCIKNKTRLNRKYGLMSHLGPAGRPFQRMSLDSIGGFGGQRSTRRYLHLLEDPFTRFTHILCSKTQDAPNFIKLIEKVPAEEKI